MKILHLEDNPRDAALAGDILAAEWTDCFITVVDTRADFVSMLRLGGFDVVLSDFQLPSFNGLEALELAQQLAPSTPFIFLSGTLGEESAIDAVRAGAADYVVKDRMQRLPMAVQRAMREAEDHRQREQAEAALQREQDLLRLLMETIPAHVYFKDLQSAYLSVSHSMARAHGLTPEQLRGRSDFDVFGPQHSRRAFEAEQEIIRTGQPQVDVEERIDWPDGHVSWMSATKLPLRNASGEIIGTFGLSHDITARKVAEERIREQAEIISAAPVAILIADLRDHVTYCNEGAVALYGRAREAMLGRSVETLFGPEFAERVRALSGDEAAAGRWTGVVPLAADGGRERQVEVHVSLIRDEQDRPRGRLAIAIDVSEKKQLEEQFLRAQRLESIGMLAAGIAHDLNNILAPVLMGAPILQAAGLGPAELRVVAAIESSAMRGAALVRQILSFAHGASGEQVLLQARHVIRDVTAFARQSFPKSIRIEEELPGGLWTVQGNPTQLHQVVLNLCVNARDAMPAGGVLNLSARNEVLDPVQALELPGGRSGAFVVIAVRDTGTGIPPDILERIWDPFFTTKEAGKGTGLGLATVRGIAASHGGFVAVETAPGTGTTFRVYLPAAEPDAVAAGHAVAGATAVPARGAGELLLFVDDEESIRELGAAVLGRFGYEVLTAVNGADALRQFTAQRGGIALVITDLGMPEMDGVTLAACVRELQPEVRVVFMTGGSVSTTSSPPPGSLLLEKPFTAETLLERVRGALATAG